jgi:aldose sugar dehydrogenase
VGGGGGASPPPPRGAGGRGGGGARLVDGEPGQLADLQVVFRQEPKLSGNAHYGSRIVFDREGYLWATLGERQHRDMAQGLDNHIGKVVRLNADGSVPRDNPFVGEPRARPEIWSYGHRNPQGMAVHPQTGVVWTHEHGPRGGDELNVPRPGGNHGWPIATYGREYWSGAIFEGDRFPPEMEEPLHHWTPALAPSGMAFYVGEAIPQWQGDLLIGGLVGQRLVRLRLDGERVVHEEDLLRPLGHRLRHSDDFGVPAEAKEAVADGDEPNA